jgi:hypothetical protein
MARGFSPTSPKRLRKEGGTWFFFRRALERQSTRPEVECYAPPFVKRSNSKSPRSVASYLLNISGPSYYSW